MLSKSDGLLVLRFLLAYSRLSGSRRKEWAHKLAVEQKHSASMMAVRRPKVNVRKLHASREGVIASDDISELLTPLWACTEYTSCELPPPRPLASGEYGQ
jgi:hypothetical protein